MDSLSKDNHRHTTDKYWSGFFVVILICWIMSWHHAVVHHRTDYAIFPSNSTIEKNISQLDFRQMNYSINSGNDAVTKNISDFSHHEIANETNRRNDRSKEKKRQELNSSEFFYSLVELYICNPATLTGLSKTLPYDPNILMLKGLISTAYFIISLILIRINEVLREQPFVVGTTFLSVALLEHMSVMYHSNDSLVTSSLTFHEKLNCWVIPEIMFLVILLSNMVSAGVFKKYDDCEDPCAKKILKDDDGNSDSKNDSVFIKFPYHYYVYSIIFGFPFIIILKILLNSTINILYKIGWNSVHSYVIAGGTCYLGLTIYYFGLMVTAYALSIVIQDSSQSMYKSFRRALFVVVRYHFGTACYHATFIFPRLHASIVMYEPTLKPFVGESSKLCVTHFYIYKLSTTLTSVAGISHSESIRNLLHLYYGYVLSNRSLQDFGSISKSLLLLLLSTNCFVIISLADFSAFDNRLAMATWVMYLEMVFVFSLAMGFIASASGAFELSMVQNDWGHLSDENLYKTVLQLMSEDKLSDDKVSV